MTESESVALPFGDSAIFIISVPLSVARYLVYTKFRINASTFFNFFKIFDYSVEKALTLQLDCDNLEKIY